ncbi:MAG: hypothetical protein ABL974_07975, partial [Prosthecobacter sp.]
PQIVSAMEQSAHHRYYFDLAHKIKALGLEFYDLHSSKDLGIQPGEFSDTHHGGNTAYMRILSAILRQNPASPLTKIVDQSKIARWVEENRGTTVAIFEHDHIDVVETDFLGMGIVKDQSPLLLQTTPKER